MKRKMTAVICAAALLLNTAVCGKAPNENASSELKQGNEASEVTAIDPPASGEASPLHIHFMMPYAEDHALAKSCAAVAAEYKKINSAFEYEPEYISDSEAASGSLVKSRTL